MNFQWTILKYFLEADNVCFSFGDVKAAFSEKNPAYLSQVLSKMVRTGKLIKLKRGLYYIVPMGQDGKSYIPDWHLVAKHLMKGKNYYIGYYSAMQIHKLITQPSLTETIVVDTQIKPNILKIQGVRFQFIYHNQRRFFGIQKTWIDDYNKANCSDLEKTLVDSYIAPQHSGGIVEVAKATYQAKDKTDIEKLFGYFTKAGSKVAARRYVYICDLFGISGFHHELFLKNNLSNVILRLDPSLPDQGKIIVKYGLRINHDFETIKQAIYS
ncbi:MAG TPA: transcriptional regulator [Bacteroidetes bacterium]|nr:transcriptional regulator [Bacteroidota bacterium]